VGLGKVIFVVTAAVVTFHLGSCAKVVESIPPKGRVENFCSDSFFVD
jgi:hypothetical protein